MTKENSISLLQGNTLELHYWFDDKSHTMDANIQNKCEYDFLGVIKEVATTLNLEIVIETEPLADGGIKRWFKIISKEEGKKATIKIALITALTTSIFITPITTTVSTITEKLIEKIFEDTEIKELEKEKLKLQIEKLKQETQQNNASLDSNNVIKKKKSNFYETLEKYPKVNKVSFVVENENKTQVKKEESVFRKDFKKYILVNDDIDPIEKENAIIEIISPVLKKGSYKWYGIYDGISIPFNMKSKEFRTLVQTGKIQFKNGTSINCFLTIRKKIDNEGLEKIVGYDVVRVNNYFENDKPIETSEGKNHREKKEADKRQLNLF